MGVRDVQILPGRTNFCHGILRGIVYIIAVLIVHRQLFLDERIVHGSVPMPCICLKYVLLCIYVFHTLIVFTL